MMNFAELPYYNLPDALREISWQMDYDLERYYGWVSEMQDELGDHSIPVSSYTTKMALALAQRVNDFWAAKRAARQNAEEPEEIPF